MCGVINASIVVCLYHIVRLPGSSDCPLIVRMNLKIANLLSELTKYIIASDPLYCMRITFKNVPFISYRGDLRAINIILGKMT